MDHTFKLPPRLAAIAALVPDGARLADVGTDHALLPIRLLLDGKIQSAVATDIRPGPLSRAKENACAAGVSGRIGFCRTRIWRFGIGIFK